MSDFKDAVDALASSMFKTQFPTGLIKDSHSNNITMSDWNSLVDYCEHLISDVKLLTDFVKQVKNEDLLVNADDAPDILYGTDKNGNQATLHQNGFVSKVEELSNDGKPYLKLTFADGSTEDVALANTLSVTPSVFGSIQLGYDSADGILTLAYTVDGETKTKDVNLPIERSIKTIEEIEIDGKYYLKLTLQNGEYEEIELDNIFKGFVKTRSEANKIYGTDADEKDTVYSIDNEGVANKDSIVRRTYNNGGIFVPTLPSSGNEAASKFYVDKFVPIEPYNDFISGIPVIYSRDHAGDVVPLIYDDIVYWDGEELPFDPDAIDSTYGGCIVQRGIDGEIYVPLVPTANAQAASKKYVDDKLESSSGGGSAKLYKHRVKIQTIWNDETWMSDPDFTFYLNFYRTSNTPITNFGELQPHEMVLEGGFKLIRYDGPEANNIAIAVRKTSAGYLEIEYIEDVSYDSGSYTNIETYSPTKFTITDTVYEV